MKEIFNLKTRAGPILAKRINKYSEAHWRVAMAMGGAMDACGRCMKVSLVVVNMLTFVLALIFSCGLFVKIE
ncbi:unnamed protein product, partial [Brenthis ino]